MIIPIVISICSVIVSLTPTPQDDKVWAKLYKYLEILSLAIGKAKDKNHGPYVVTSVSTNGTVRIQRGSVNERINIRRLTPFFDTEEATEASD